MLHRESGVYKTSYAADMALYPLPIARWSIAAIILLFAVVLPTTLDEYYLSIINLVLIAVVGALGLNILVGYTGQISVGHAAFMSVGAYTAANLAVKLGLPFWITLPAGGLMAALIGAIVGIPSVEDQGSLPRHSDAGWPTDHRVDHQSHAGDLGRGTGVDRGAEAGAVGPSDEDQGQLYFFLLFFAALATLARSEYCAQPHRQGIRCHSRSGHCGRNHRH